jgi:hypothetical protein
MIIYTNIRWDSRTNSKPMENIIDRTLKLDGGLLASVLSMSPSWKTRITLVNYDSERIYGPHFDSYASVKFGTSWNPTFEAAMPRQESAGSPHVKDKYVSIEKGEILCA